MNTNHILSGINKVLTESAKAGLHVGLGHHAVVHGTPFFAHTPVLTLHPNYQELEVKVPSENASRATVLHSTDNEANPKGLQIFHDVPHTWMHQNGVLEHTWEPRHRSSGSVGQLLENHNLTEEEIAHKKLEEPSIYDVSPEGRVLTPHKETHSDRFSHPSELINHMLSLPYVGHFYGRAHGVSPIGTPVSKSTLMDHYDLARHHAAMSVYPHATSVNEDPHFGAYLHADPRHLRTSSRLPANMIHVMHRDDTHEWSHYAYNPGTEQLHLLQSSEDGKFNDNPEF